MNEPPPVLPEMQADAVRDARMTGALAAGPGKPLASWAITMALGGLFLGFVGATDSYEYPLAERLAVWLGLCAVGGVIAFTIERALVASGLRSSRAVVWWAVLTTTLAVAMVPVIFLVNSTGSSSQFAYLPVFAVNSFAISAALAGLRLVVGTLLDRSNAPNEAEALEGATQEPPRLLQRLKPALQTAPLLALKSEGHYLRVFTKEGSELILMRLKDAMEETAPVEGMQVHRSWWLARQPGLERRSVDGRIEVKLDEDNWVPISRTHRADWLAADW